MRPDEIASRDAVELAGLIRSKEVRAAEVQDAAREAVLRVNPQVNGLAGNLFDQPLEYDESGYFGGLPFLVKDAGVTLAGIPHEIGSRMLAGYRPEADSDMALRFKRAGLAIIGRTATPEFTFCWNTVSLANGVTANPWDLERTTGGSSGGSAALVAAGAVPMAHGNDGAGSIRIPASCCGLVGLKPTRGRTDLGLADLGDDFSIEFGLTRTVRDSAALLDAVQGTSPGERYQIAPPIRPYVDELGRDPGRLRIAFFTGAPIPGVDRECMKAVEQVAKRLDGLGHDVSAGAPPPPSPDGAQDAAIGSSALFAAWVDRMAMLHGVKPSADNLETIMWRFTQLGRKVSAVQLLRTNAGRVIATAAIRQFFTQYDVFVTPTIATPPPPLNTLSLNDDADPMEWVPRMFGYMPFTPAFNMTGNPAISLPIAESSAWLPIGVQFVARFGDEAMLFRLAAQLESAFPWRQRTPRVHATTVLQT